MTSARYTSPFTAIQWQELEHQALIYKYIISGVPVPAELIYSLKRNLDSSLSSGLLFHQPPIGSSWEGCFQMGFGRKADPEPWRCRRTDGKKWRCAKEAHPDSKYCEKHMHRGKNRSRKPVEASSTPRTPPPPPPPPKTSSNLSPSVSSINRNFSPYVTTTTSAHSLSYPFLYSHNSSTSKPFDTVLSAQKHASTHQLFLDSGNDKDHRDGMDRGYGVKELPPGRSCLSVTCEPLTSPYYSQPELQNMSDNLNDEQEQQSCFLWGTEFKSSKQTKAEGSDGDPTQKPLHHFFGEWPPKDADSWL